MIVIILVALYFASYVLVAAVLVRNYLRSREIGFIWLGGAVLIWPLVLRVLERIERVYIGRLLRGEPVSFFPFSLVAHRRMSLGSLTTVLDLLQRIIGGGLLLVAVLYLARSRRPPTQTDAVG
jgi:hypothetical protein